MKISRKQDKRLSEGNDFGNDTQKKRNDKEKEEMVAPKRINVSLVSLVRACVLVYTATTTTTTLLLLHYN